MAHLNPVQQMMLAACVEGVDEFMDGLHARLTVSTGGEDVRTFHLAMTRTEIQEFLDKIVEMLASDLKKDMNSGEWVRSCR